MEASPPVKPLKVITLAAVLVLAAGSARSAEHDVYPEPGQSRAALAAALRQAPAAHKRILIDFGGNWCGDCQVLDLYFHDVHNSKLLNSNFILVPMNVGHYDANLDIAKRYGIPLDKGVPALAVLSEKGTLLYSQRTGEFEAMRGMESSAVTGFLVQWKPARPGCSAVMVNC